MRKFRFDGELGAVDDFGYVKFKGSYFHYTHAKGDLRTVLNNLMEL